jgi:methylmalonic aciduria homocystinuria type C protein
MYDLHDPDGSSQDSSTPAVRLVSERLTPTGLDLVAPLTLGAYQQAVPEPLRLSARDDRLALVVGNTRALWPLFLKAFQRQLDLQRASDPLDRYVEQALARALEGLPVLEVRFAHELPPRRVAIQRAADLAGMASLSPAHLSVHPIYGPWIALRALVVLDMPASTSTPWPAAPCWEGCRRPCLEALQKALEVGWDPKKTWPAWVAIRDACPRGQRYRYSEEALRYHYARDRKVLGLLSPEEGWRAGPSSPGAR